MQWFIHRALKYSAVTETHVRRMRVIVPRIASAPVRTDGGQVRSQYTRVLN